MDIRHGQSGLTYAWKTGRVGQLLQRLPIAGNLQPLAVSDHDGVNAHALLVGFGYAPSEFVDSL